MRTAVHVVIACIGQVCAGCGSHLHWHACRRQLISSTDFVSLAPLGSTDACPDSCISGIDVEAVECLQVHSCAPRAAIPFVVFRRHADQAVGLGQGEKLFNTCLLMQGCPHTHVGDRFRHDIGEVVSLKWFTAGMQGWACTQVFESHSHYVMQCVFNPKDTNTFASASLDRTVKVMSCV